MPLWFLHKSFAVPNQRWVQVAPAWPGAAPHLTCAQVAAPASFPIFIYIFLFFLTQWQVERSVKKRKRPCGLPRHGCRRSVNTREAGAPWPGRGGLSGYSAFAVWEGESYCGKTLQLYCSNLYLNIESITHFSREFKIAVFLLATNFWGIAYLCIILWSWRRASLGGENNWNSRQRSMV